tara:strand:- start:191 stop:298 length:108 start_codon:yes stop_codon:yes gene_type:complete
LKNKIYIADLTHTAPDAAKKIREQQPARRSWEDSS